MTRDSNYLHKAATKVPEVTLIFWIIKIAATTLGETGGDSVTMTLNWGYLSGTIQPIPPLGYHRRLDDIRHDYGRFRRSLFGHRL
jgi:hypothetical protein